MGGGVVRSVAFDLGETLVDETRYWGEWAKVLGLTPLDLFARLGAAIERGDRHGSVLADADPGVEIPSFVETDLYPDARAALESLRAAGVRIAVAGNFGKKVADEVRTWGLATDVVVSAEELGAEKPDPRFFTGVARVVDVRPEELLYVGDRIDNDVVAAQAIGCHAVFLRRGPWAAIQQRTMTVDAPAIDSLSDVESLIASLG